MIKSNTDLNYAIVAFVDILGFSEMVKNDCENKSGQLKYFNVLRTINSKTKNINDCFITQFSDSVIFSLPLGDENCKKMIKILSDYQFELLCNSIVCRGAIAFGKHFSENDFLFSQALIEAYQLEHYEACNPRIIISQDLIDLYNIAEDSNWPVIKERDGYYFVDYLTGMDKEKSRNILCTFDKNRNSYDARIKEKYYWLYEYWEHVFDEKLPFLPLRFNSQIGN